MPSHVVSVVLALLSSSLFAGAAPTDTRDSSTSDLAARDSGYCFGSCYGANNSVFDKCITQFCNSYVNSQLSYNNLNGHQDHISATITYNPTPGTGEQGKMFFEIATSNNGWCPDVVDLGDFGACQAALWQPINHCDLPGKDNKHGGVYNGNCLTYVITPNPEGC